MVEVYTKQLPNDKQLTNDNTVSSTGAAQHCIGCLVQLRCLECVQLGTERLQTLSSVAMTEAFRSTNEHILFSFCGDDIPLKP